jgi:hypothetical protein
MFSVVICFEYFPSKQLNKRITNSNICTFSDNKKLGAQERCATSHRVPQSVKPKAVIVCHKKLETKIFNVKLKLFLGLTN